MVNKLSYKRIILVYIAFSLIVVIGHIRDQFGKIFLPSLYEKYFDKDKLSPLFTTFESFYIRRMYKRISDCWERPICSTPNNKIEIVERIFDDQNDQFKITGKKIDCLNFASYNYLGFSTNQGEIVGSDIKTVYEDLDIISDLPPIAYKNEIIKNLEMELAAFLGKEDAVVFQMGYGTNALNIPVIMEDSLIFSDELNHTSLISGMKAIGGKVVVYSHKNLSDLEKKLIFNISQGKPVTHRSWSRIFVITEGLFSMEGTIPDLKKLVELKKKYKFYIYLDEAHSIGSLGRTGKGVCEYLGVDFNDIDIMMGTFTKSFGGYGGYIAGDKKLINFLRFNSHFSLYSEPMSPIVANHVLKALLEIKKSNEKIKKLNYNVRYMREKLHKKKFHLLGDKNSPIIPILIYNPGKIAEFSRLCLERGFAVVVVGFPATSLLYSRARICVSSAHSQEEIDTAIKIINKVGTLLGMKKS
ncbi:LCB2b [Nucleospora cyclopteri]